MPSSTKSNKETQLLFSLDPASLERSICKEIRSSSIDNNTCSSLDFRQPPSTQTLASSTDTRSPPSTEDTNLSSTDIFHPTSIDTSVRALIDTEPRDMVATLILVRDERGDLHDQEGHLRNAVGQRIDAQGPKPKPSDNPPETIRIPSDDATDPMEVDTVSMGRTLRKRKEKVSKHLKRGANEKERESFQKSVFRILLEKPFEEAYFTHKLWMFFIETRETEEDIRRMLCEAREKVKKRITLKKKSDPRKFAIPCTMKGIEFPHALCDTRASISILPRVMADHLGLQMKHSKESFTFVDFSQRSSGGIVRDLEVQIGNALVPVNFHVLVIKLNWNSSLLLGRAFLATVEAVCSLQTNQLCLTLIDPHVHYNPIPVKKPQTSSRSINDPGLIAACHCGAEYETKYSASIETHTATSIDSIQKKSIDISEKESVDSSLEDWENDYYNPTMTAHTRHTMHTEEYEEDYEKERAIEYKAVLDKEDRLLHHCPWKRNAPSIDRTVSTSIDTHPHQTSRKRESTKIAYYPPIDTGVDRVREGDYSIGSWADDHHHESYAVEMEIQEPGADGLHEAFTYEEPLNMQRRDEADQQ
ncbi:hypothetical protein F2Q70_00038565 [Brassica cretica]|uniref:Aspartic peptidase DDI1-type domain-containing protein n=1 Tax=Brassica cretica TaxID=69181 RepID=A0A8S9K2M3_BRACR|nr:hypothetical protein F2Q70_00038565 [Brassica cretica]